MGGWVGLTGRGGGSRVATFFTSRAGQCKSLIVMPCMIQPFELHHSTSTSWLLHASTATGKLGASLARPAADPEHLDLYSLYVLMHLMQTGKL